MFLREIKYINPLWGILSTWQERGPDGVPHVHRSARDAAHIDTLQIAWGETDSMDLEWWMSGNYLNILMYSDHSWMDGECICEYYCFFLKIWFRTYSKMTSLKWLHFSIPMSCYHHWGAGIDRWWDPDRVSSRHRGATELWIFVRIEATTWS